MLSMRHARSNRSAKKVQGSSYLAYGGGRTGFDTSNRVNRRPCPASPRMTPHRSRQQLDTSLGLPLHPPLPRRPTHAHPHHRTQAPPTASPSSDFARRPDRSIQVRPAVSCLSPSVSHPTPDDARTRIEQIGGGVGISGVGPLTACQSSIVHPDTHTHRSTYLNQFVRPSPPRPTPNQTQADRSPNHPRRIDPPQHTHTPTHPKAKLPCRTPPRPARAPAARACPPPMPRPAAAPRGT